MREKGNILFLILLAVALFAVLAYAVTSSMRGGGNDVSKEQAKSNAAAILGYFSLVENTVQRMVLTGVKPEHLDFFTGGAPLAYGAANANCASDDCRVFRQANAMPAPKTAYDRSLPYNAIWLHTPDKDGVFFSILISVKNVGTPLADIVIGYKALNKETCDQINILSGLYNQGEAMTDPAETLGGLGTHYVDFFGNIDPFPTLPANQFGSIDPRIAGKSTFCILRSGTSGYYAYHVVYPR